MCCNSSIGRWSVASVAACLVSSAVFLPVRATATESSDILATFEEGTYEARILTDLDQLPEQERKNRLVLPASYTTDVGGPAGLFFVNGEAKRRMDGRMDGLVVVGKKGQIQIDALEELQHKGESLDLRQSAEDYSTFEKDVTAKKWSVIQSHLWIHDGKSLLSPHAPRDRYRRLTLYEDADGTLAIHFTGPQHLSTKELVAELMERGAVEAVALDPAGVFCTRTEKTEEGIRSIPCGGGSASYLMVDFD